jgi:ELWxxDGT repeat protein
VQSPETSPVKWNGLLFFLARNAADGWDLWRSDGSASGTLQLPDSVAGEDWHAAFLLAGRDGVYFSTGPRGLDLWKTDGSVQGTGPIASLELGGGQYGFSISPEHATLGGNVVFPFASPPSGFELWRTDGTAAGTDLVADVLAGPEGSDPGGLVGLGDIVLFGASGDEVGRELWRSDGSAAGTVLVKDIKPGSESSQPTEPALLGAAAYFFADDGGGRTLWRSDGTDAGTVQVELTPPPAAYGFSGPLRVAEALFFARRDPASGTTLWRSDGTDAGTGAFASLTGTTRDAWINYMIESDGALLFTTGGDQEEHLSDQIWRSDGSEAGTLLVADTNPSGFGDPVFLAEARGSIYFLADDGTHGVELWRLDGTPGSARMVADIRPGPEGSARQLDANPAIVVGGILYFVADDGVHGDELWRSDGTEEGTGLVKDILPGVDSPSVGGFASLGDTLFFSAQHEYLAGYSLWRSDGTEAGTEILVNTALPSGHYDRHPIAAAGDALFFRAGTPNDGFELWRTDGSPSGSERVHMATPGDLDPRFLVPAGDEVFFAATDAEHGAELWRSDGTEEGTSLVADIRPGGEGSIPFPARAAALGRRIFFVAEDGSHGEQLWVSDGTRSTTRRLTDIDPEASSSPGGTLRELTPASDRIFFVAPTPSGTTGIWQSDGTECGAAPIALPEGASDPHTLTVAGPHLFFAAHTQAHGEELWALPVDAKSSGGSCGGPRVSPRLRGSTKVPPKLARR